MTGARVSRAALTGLALSVLTLAPAQADVGVWMQIKGYSELFKECEFGLGFDTFGANYSKVDVQYEVHVRGDKVKTCIASWSPEGWVDTDCSGEIGIENDDHTCEELTKVRMTGWRCMDAAGAEVNCGTMKIGGADVFTFD
ncbi:MAG: hypothetical protein AAGH68_00040 [Pseudomonadota bacterium]